MTPIKPFAIGLLIFVLLGFGVALYEGVDPGFLVIFSLIGAATMAFILAFSAVGLGVWARLTGMYDAFPRAAERLGGRVRKNALGERQVSAPGPRGGRWIVELRTSAESYQQARSGGHSRWTALAWRAPRDTSPPPRAEIMLGSDTAKAPDLPPAATAALATLHAELPGAKLRLRPANLLIPEHEVGLMWPGYITSPDDLDATITRAQPLLQALVEALG